MADFGTETDHLGRTQFWREKVIDFRKWRENGTQELIFFRETGAHSNYAMGQGKLFRCVQSTVGSHTQAIRWSEAPALYSFCITETSLSLTSFCLSSS
jgi:hypothetical protein